jgi:hypothetical protein
MGFIVTEFVRVPEPEVRYRHQSNAMTVVAYLATEGSRIKAGAPIVRLENWWAVFEVVTAVPATVAKNLYDWAPSITLSTGREIALLAYDDDLPKDAVLFSTRVVSVKHEKKG